jgi:hypothetical protein
MSAPPWKRLVEQLQSSGYESEYLDRLRAQVSAEEQALLLERELVEEMARALGRTAAKVDYALLRLELLEREGSSNDDYNRVRDEAIRARHDLLIHREAIGIRDNNILAHIYPIPPKR